MMFGNSGLEGDMRSLSIGKYRGLQQCANAKGGFSILALDHRNNLRRLLQLDESDKNLADRMAAFKRSIVSSLSSVSSAFLLDPLYGAAQSVAASALPGNVGLLVALEKTGYTGDPTARNSQLLSGWGVDKIKRMGASAVKLLVYYHPKAPTHINIEDLVKTAAEACYKEDIPLFLEILTYALDPEQKKLSGQERQDVILAAAEQLTPLGVDVLKAEFPLDFKQDTDLNHWRMACRRLTESSCVPWVLLSASVDFEIYLEQVIAACTNGASGVAVGRAVWKEAVEHEGKDLDHFLQTTALERMRKVSGVVDALAVPWVKYYSPPTISDEWYKTY